MPFGMHGVFSAIATGGVVFAYQGFEQAVQLGGETANPRRNIPIAVVGAMVLGVVVYVLLQVAFIAALDPANLSHGWTKLAFNGLVGPFAGLATAVGLGWLAVLLYVDAAVSPGGTGLLYTGTSARVAYALGHEGYLPGFLARLNRRGIPLIPTLLSFVIGVVLFLPFPGWQKLVGFITAASNLSYGIAAVSLGALRKQDRDRERPFRLPFATVLAPVGFAVANLIIYWSGWTTVWRISVALGIGFVAFVAYRVTGERERMPRLDLRAAAWLPPYFAGMAIISWLGQYDGRSLIPFGWDIGVVAVFSFAIYALAMTLRLSDAEAKEYIERLGPMMEDEAADAPLAREG
jgi:amino acid transporter